MCGVAGFWRWPAPSPEEAEAVLRRMADALRHRGPDDAGTWFDPRAGVGFGHRRLSILDLSPAGHQPMASSCGRYVITYNGEIYNFRELRAELERDGRRFRGGSDTEVILEAASAWGVGTAVRRLAGMYAFGLWDARERRLHLVRDRLGEKPLYYHRGEGLLLFGSELKALCTWPSFPRDVDRRALALYLRYLCVPAPHTIFRGVAKVLPGHVVSFDLSDPDRPRGPEIEAYWDPFRLAEGAGAPEGDDRAEVDEFERLLARSVSERMVSDVPLGALLSGGIDSTTVAALMQRASSRPVKTFTVGFREARFDEARYARPVARHLGTDHTEFTVTPSEALDVVPSLAEIYDEPFADSSQIPTLVVSRLARSRVTVALSGDGGDELLGGYNRHRWAALVARAIDWSPAPLRRTLSRALLAVPQEGWDQAFEQVRDVLPRAPRRMGEKVHKFAVALPCRDRDEAYRRIVATGWDPAEILLPGALDGFEEADPVRRLQGLLAVQDPATRMRVIDLGTYLPDDILVKVDRASMAVSLEVRAPYLDHRLIEHVGRLSPRFAVRDGAGKWLLRQVLHRHVPRELVERPKAGFSVPVAEWLRGPLRTWAEDRLGEEALRRSSFFDARAVRRCWREHLGGGRDRSSRLWAVLMFQEWKDRWRAT